MVSMNSKGSGQTAGLSEVLLCAYKLSPAFAFHNLIIHCQETTNGRIVTYDISDNES